MCQEGFVHPSARVLFDLHVNVMMDGGWASEWVFVADTTAFQLSIVNCTGVVPSDQQIQLGPGA